MDWAKTFTAGVVASLLLGFAAMPLSAAETEAAGAYSPGPPIAGKIRLVSGEKWAHTDDATEWCTVELYDTVDTDCLNGEARPGDYYRDAEFACGDRGYCEPATHVSCTRYNATGRGSSEVIARLRDDVTAPSPDADDPDTVLTLGLNPRTGDFCHGFSVYVVGHMTGEFREVSWVVHEGDTDSRTKGPAEWEPWTRVNGDGTWRQIRGESEQYHRITWYFKTVPSHAEPRRLIKAKVRYVPTAFWEYNFEDDDLRDGNAKFTVPLPTALGGPISWGMVDNEEGAFAGVWTYTADGVGTDRLPKTPDFSDCTGNYPERRIPFKTDVSKTKDGTSMLEETGDGYVMRPKNRHCASAYVVRADVVAVDDNDKKSWAKARVRFGACAFYVDEVAY